MSGPVPKGTGMLQSSVGARYAGMLGIGGYRPERVVTNDEVCTWIDSSDTWIRERTGIISRRWASEEQTIVDMAAEAAAPALEMAGITADQLSAVIVATVTHTMQTPAAAPMLATRIGAKDAAAFDISAACAGYCHGVSLASDMVRGGSAEYVLVVGVEKLSDITDKRDRGSAFIFADGAGAAVIGPTDTPGIGPTVWGSDGEKWEAISQRVPWDRIVALQLQEATTGEPADWVAAGAMDATEASTLKMAGQTVFRWAVWSMAPVAQQAIEAAGITASDLDAFVPHQANMRITDAMIKQLKLPADIPVARDIAETGNTSAASIPLATERMLREGEVPHGGLALQIGFGAGLAYAAQVVRLP
ncbi:beta-ketoacyl-ACP synthase III [Allobranchiibius huperziae]|uniref:Beta-ketoacyl-[acyl-carrier-protein] synthase III n=1 Tax=Allobranchiibius huperziae TaxID=1874116 RepID=A0A853DHQ3_9MICO|nr:beta-ketoacyl-ACP synthase III [Allobranchiibius huperziae]NYJ74351.1 3-oxoacyl-[acyl-carrier-protein] synthase-3 [Allobranchiibius huperziae]